MQSGQVTEWLARWSDGRHEVLDRIVPHVYLELRKIAHRHLRHELPHLTLSATGLVHEVYLRLLQQRQIGASDRRSFLAIAGRMMRRILVDHARARRCVKRHPDGGTVPLDDESVRLLTDAEIDEVLALESVLDTLAAADERTARIVEYRVFAGFTLEETAEALEVSTKTVQRSWMAAQAWLRKELRGTAEKGAS